MNITHIEHIGIAVSDLENAISIYEKVFGANWQKILNKEGGIEDIEDIDIEKEREILTERLGRKPTDQQLVTYLQHPNDAVNFFKFEEEFGQTYVLPPSIFLRRGSYKLGEALMFKDHYGKEHVVEIGPKQKDEKGEWSIYLNVDHQERNYTFKEEAKEAAAAAGPQLSKKEIEDLAKAGDMRATFSCNVCEIAVKEDDEVKVGDKLAVVEAMKMQTPVVSLVEGTVMEIHAKVGDALKVGDKILKILTEVK